MWAQTGIRADLDIPLSLRSANRDGFFLDMYLTGIADGLFGWSTADQAVNWAGLRGNRVFNVHDHRAFL